jgi:hypothetical protein
MFFDMIQKIDDYFAVSLLLSDMGDTFPLSPECGLSVFQFSRKGSSQQYHCDLSGNSKQGQQYL